jgi:hypothetical protein
MSDDEKIIPFPNSNKFRTKPEPTPEIIVEHNTNLKLTHINQTLEFLNELLLDQLEIGGFQFDYEDNALIKDVALISESIRALLHKYYGMEHPLHKVSESLYEINKQDETVIYKEKEEIPE